MIGLLAAAAIVASACGTPAPSEGVPPSPSATAAAGASADFRFAIDGEPTYFSPSSTDQATSWVNHLIYTGLYRVNNTGDVVPDLATAMPEIGADGRTLTIRIRTDARWHDGSLVTSADAKFTFDIAMSPKCTFNPTTCTTWQQHVGSVEAPSPATLVVTLKDPYAPIYMLGLTLGLVPKAATEASYARFVTGSSAVDPAATATLATRISTAQGNPVCTGVTPPGSCSASFFGADMEAILTSAGIALPDQARFVRADGTLDPAAYAGALLAQLTDLNATLHASAPDRLAAAYRLLDINLHPVGSGPYSFVRYTPGRSVELARFVGYYLVTPGPANVLVLIIKAAAAAAEALQSGEIDWLPDIASSDSLPALKADPTLRLSEYPEPSYLYVGFNVRSGHPFSDLVARQAFAMCIDHDATVQAATQGSAIPVNAEVPPGSFFFDPTVPDYQFNVAGARALLEKDGYTLSDGVYTKAGIALKADLYVRQDKPQRVAFALLARDQVAKCGIEITVREADYATVLVSLLSYPNNFELYLGGWGDLVDPEDSSIFGCSHVTSKAAPFENNFTGYCDPKLDALQAAAAQQLDRTKRKAILAQVQHYLHDRGPYYFLWTDLGHRGYSARVGTNGSEGPIDYTSFYDWWNMDSWVVGP